MAIRLDNLEKSTALMYEKCKDLLLNEVQATHRGFYKSSRQRLDNSIDHLCLALWALSLTGGVSIDRVQQRLQQLSGGIGSLKPVPSNMDTADTIDTNDIDPIKLQEALNAIEHIIKNIYE